MIQAGFTKTIIILIVIVVVGVIGYFVLTSKQPISPRGEVSKEKMTEISVSPKPISGSHPKLSHDGTKIAYRRNRTGDDGLWVVNTDGSSLRKLTSETPSGEGTFDFGWSLDDEHIFYVRGGIDLPGQEPLSAELKIISVSTGSIKTLFTAPDVGKGFRVRHSTWLSQDEIAFILHDDFGVPNVSVKLVDVMSGQIVESIKEIRLYFWLTKGSPESSVIASVSTSGVVKELTPSGALSVPSVAPHATKIAYINQQGIVVMDNDGSNAKVILPHIDYEPTVDMALFSPDGKKLVYSKSKDDGHYITESDIYMINVDGSNEQRLTTSGEKFATEPSWSADGKKIVFFYLGDAENQIAILEID